MPDKGQRTPKEVGQDSPSSKSSKEQQIAGAKGGPQASGESPRTEKQPPQTSNRRGAVHEHSPTVQKGYDAAQAPEAQGDGDPGPEQIQASSAQQGHAGHGGAGRGTANEDVTQRSHAGEPQDEHTTPGRQKVPGDRDPQQPD